MPPVEVILMAASCHKRKIINGVFLPTGIVLYTKDFFAFDARAVV